MPNRLPHRMFFRDRVGVQAREGAADGALPDIVGHAIIVNTRAECPWFTEEVADEAVKKVMARQDLAVKSLWNHDSSRPLGAYPQSLELKQDEIGLWTRTSPSDTSYARDLVQLIRDRVVSQMSFGFFILDETMIDGTTQDKPHFIIKEIDLFDVSPVTYPFYEQTDLHVANSDSNSEEDFKKRLALHGKAADMVMLDRMRVEREHLFRKNRIRLFK